MYKLIIGNEVFHAVPATQFGDYGGDGSVARANLNVLRDQFAERCVTGGFSSFESNGRLIEIFDSYYRNVNASEFDGVDLIILEGGYSSEQAFLREGCEEFDDIMSALADYPCLDDSEVSRVKMEWTNDAVPDAVRDVGRAMRDFGEVYEEVWDALDQEQAESVIHDALSRGTGCEVTYEYSSAYIDPDAIAKLIVDSWQGWEEHRAVKLPDGTLVSIGQVEDDEEPDENGRVSSMFVGLPSNPADYIAEFSRRCHHKGA